MLWRVRTTLPDRPGALAVLAQRCGEAGVNILGLQIFPGGEDVTDELVLRTPDDWGPAQITALLEESGGRDVVVQPSSEAALADQPTRYVQAARAILERPMSFPEVLGHLFDTEAEPAPDDGAVAGIDVMTMTVGDVEVQVRRRTPFTVTEHARGAALADVVNDVLRRSRDQAAIGAVAGSGRRLGTGAVPEYVVSGDTVTAYLDEVPVGMAKVLGLVEDPDETVRSIQLRVDPAWQRRGIGTRLLIDAARLAHMFGAGEILLTTSSDNQAVLPLVLAAGLRGRIRMAGDELTVRVSVRELRPLAG
ncbi:GNAT family N-acetyltransferase [Nocardioides sp.]|jgi:GNAT superfamily N-acetyltransferase|uniref:GNAT family N-acetyltransferase n=1 Tax=Nocardioides sp. TaxID=35761 RepID=UPI002CB82453|nr:GNAT family N-acetyltransferase [Nocardioides sp.]HVX53970.1 GNAT family N-acetyltransferase [Nocardioides sp.]